MPEVARGPGPLPLILVGLALVVYWLVTGVLEPGPEPDNRPVVTRPEPRPPTKPAPPRRP